MINLFNFTRHYDYRAYLWLYDFSNRSDLFYEVFYFFARYGIVLFLCSFIYLVIKRRVPAFLCVLLAMGVAGFIDLLVSIIWRRPQPFITYNLLVNPVGMYTDASSFPSSHTYIAFAIATSIFLYGHRRLGAALFLLAIMVAIGRIAMGLHYPSDVVGGAILGTISGVCVYKFFERWERSKERELEKRLASAK